ncbi:hypothetical protein DL96DRAFT_1082430 [Flagelloscypha sp. PMI_526]|nr:hypothetical protein DL96DRAFT_1082430 [Flagelloscypha sp. PMI_526]
MQQMYKSDFKACHLPGLSRYYPSHITFSPDIHLTRKFNTGLATSTEIAALHTQLAAANQLLRTYDFLVDTLERSATQVYRLVKFYSAYIKRGFKSLPPELLALVFQFAAAGQYNSVFAYDDLEIESPSMAISQVCQNWRRIAVHTPALWRDIAVRAPPDWIPTSAETRLARKEILALYIQRAQDTQLNVKFGIQRLMQINFRFKDTEFEFEIICRALAPYWDSVSCLQIYSRAPVGITLPLRHLKELTINGFQTPRCYDDLGFNIPGALPALRKLVTPTLPENIDSAHSPLGVTSLTIHSVSRGTFSSSMSWWN